jgi:hypothetical protein
MDGTARVGSYPLSQEIGGLAQTNSKEGEGIRVRVRKRERSTTFVM